MRFDLVILGDTPDAWAAAEQAALRGHSTALLRTDLDDSGAAAGIAGVMATYDVWSPMDATRRFRPCDLWDAAVARHRESTNRLVDALAISTWPCSVRFLDRHTLQVTTPEFTDTVKAEMILIAVGTTARRPRGLRFDRQTLLLPEDVPGIATTPDQLVVLGGNRTARAFAGLFSEAGSQVSLIDGDRGEAAPFAGPVVFGDVLEVRQHADGIEIRLVDGRRIRADAALFAADRLGATADLSLSSAGLETDEDGRLWCDDEGVTWVPTISAAGEVVGYPRRLRAGDQVYSTRRVSACRKEASGARKDPPVPFADHQPRHRNLPVEASPP